MYDTQYHFSFYLFCIKQTNEKKKKIEWSEVIMVLWWASATIIKNKTKNKQKCFVLTQFLFSFFENKSKKPIKRNNRKRFQLTPFFEPISKKPKTKVILFSEFLKLFVMFCFEKKKLPTLFGSAPPLRSASTTAVCWCLTAINKAVLLNCVKQV